jgi:hypothetical protein
MSTRCLTAGRHARHLPHVHRPARHPEHHFARYPACYPVARPFSHLLPSVVAFALALTATGAPARDDDDAAPRNHAYCSTTAATLSAACGHEVKDDYLVAKAKCINVADANERRDCLTEAKAALDEGAQLCREQLQERRVACRVLGEARYDPRVEPSLFDSNFGNLSNPNPYFPLGIGNRWELRGGGELNIVEVTNETKLIEGVRCIVLRDLVYENGQLKEATDDWFAAARDGSTWYFGEEVKDYESFAGDAPLRPELVSIDGSFKHGRDRDKAGIIMPAAPRVGQAYLEEFSLGNAEDVSEILSVTYAYGSNAELDRFVPRELAQRMCPGNCVVTKNYSLLEPGIFALKYYARGIGFFLEIKPESGVAVQLTSCNFDPRCAGLPQP